MSWLEKHISDIFSWTIGFAGIVATILATRAAISDGFLVTLIGVLAADVILVIGWLLVLYLKFSHEKEKDDLNDKIASLEAEITETKRNYTQNEAVYKEDVEKQMTDWKTQVSAMVMELKNASKMYNELCNRIPGITATSYRLLEEMGSIKEQNEEKLQKILSNSHNDFSIGLFTLFKQYTSNLLTHTVNIIGGYLEINGCSIRVSSTVKLFDKPYNTRECDRSKILVYTAFRDKKTYDEHKREIGEESYTIDGNVDFSRCIKKEHYIVNNAQKDDPSYLNEHTDFDAYYNCAVVVPVRAKMSDGSFKILGYLCCDCKNANPGVKVFDEVTANILFTLAQMYANFLESLEANWLDRFVEIESEKDSFLGVICEKTYTGERK